MTNEDIIAAVLKYEGGYVNDPADSGGATNWGITQATLTAWRQSQPLGRLPVTVAEVKALTKEEAARIYLALYLERPGFGKITDMRLRHLVVDSGVNHGVKRPAMWLQTLLGLKADGVFGPKTVYAVNLLPSELFNRLLAARIRFYGDIISGNQSQARFAKGWLNRVTSFLDA